MSAGTAPVAALAGEIEPAVRAQMLVHYRRMMLALLAEIQFLRGRRAPSFRRPVSAHVVLLRDRRRGFERRLAAFREIHTSYRSLASQARGAA